MEFQPRRAKSERQRRASPVGSLDVTRRIANLTASCQEPVDRMAIRKYYSESLRQT
jgi:hypothetical protein